MKIFDYNYLYSAYADDKAFLEENISIKIKTKFNKI